MGIYELEWDYSPVILAFVILVLSIIFGVDNLLAIAILVFVAYFLIISRPRRKSNRRVRERRRVRRRRR